MSYSQCWVVARWDRPLSELAVNARLPDWTTGHEIEWRRDDGWQRFAPEDFYDGVLLPPVTAVAEQTGGPVLGAAVASSSQLSFAWLDAEGQLRTLRVGEDPEAEERESTSAVRRRMEEAWGSPWQYGAVDSLVTWAGVEDPQRRTESALVLALAVEQGPLHQVVDDVLELLGLGHEQPPWWRAVPELAYAIGSDDLWLDLWREDELGEDLDLALALSTDLTTGIWSRRSGTWFSAPVPDPNRVLSELRQALLDRGWQELPPAATR